MAYYVYILQSETNGSYYIGFSGNPEKRLEKHNKALSGYTSRNKPWKIVYKEAFIEKSEAIKREMFLKNQKSREFIERLISSTLP
jgi:putative endonuclease